MQQERVKPTLKRTKYACVNCKAAKAACDSNRPCAWCIRHALQDSCVDAPRKTRTSKKICCDPSMHKNVVFKQEYKGFQLALASDFVPTTAVPTDQPLSPPNDIFPIEDFLAPGGFDFGLNTAAQPCSNCPLYQTCAKDAPQRLICATSASPPQSPLTPEGQDDDTEATPDYIPVALGSHPDFCLMTPMSRTPPTPLPNLEASISSMPSTPSTISPQQAQSTPEPESPSAYLIQPPTPGQKVSTPPSTVQNQLVLQPPAPVARSGCCSSLSSSPPLLDELCNCQSLVQREMAKINASLDTISALMALQNSSLLPMATFQLPDTTLEDCNDEFAKALGYEGKDDLLSSATIDSITSSTKDMMTASDPTNPKKEHKPALLSLVPESSIPSVQRYSANLMKASSPTINQIVFTTKKGDTKFFTVLAKPFGMYSYITILKQHPQLVEGLGLCGE